MTILTDGCGSVIKWISTRVVVDAILTDKWIYGEKSLRIERVLIPETKTKCLGELALILAELIVCIGNLKPVASAKKIQVERVAAAGLKIDTVKNRLVISLVVKRSEFRAVQKTPASICVQNEEIAPFRAAYAKCGFFAYIPKRAVICV